MTTPNRKFSPGGPTRPGIRTAPATSAPGTLVSRPGAVVPNLGPQVIGPDGRTRHQPQDEQVKFGGDAFATIKAILADYGLESLAGFVRDSLVEGKSEAEIMFELRDRPEFKAEFPEIELRKKKGLAALSPGEIISYRRGAAQMMRAAGIPQDFYNSREDFTKFLVNDVSLAELNDRVQLGRQASYESPADVREALMRDYGVDEGGLTAFFLDPDRAQPLLEQQWAAAKIGGAATRTGFGTTTREQNERLAGLGVTADQAQQGFGALAEQRELFTPINFAEQHITADEQLGAVFGGDAAASQKVEKRRRGRQAAFEGGGSALTSQQGVVGLGDTRR